MFAENYTLSGCGLSDRFCGVYTHVPAQCTAGPHCPGGDLANGNTDRTLCDGAPVYASDVHGGWVLLRSYEGGRSRWAISQRNALSTCLDDSDIQGRPRSEGVRGDLGSLPYGQYTDGRGSNKHVYMVTNTPISVVMH